jgi:hypothetical protein
MPWWRKSQRDGVSRNDGAEQVADDTAFGPIDAVTVRRRVPAERTGVHDLMPLLKAASSGPSPVTTDRLSAALRRLDVYFLTDPGTGNLVAMWERHAVMFALEGPDRDILMVRARAHGTVPPDWAAQAFPAVNSWNHDRRFLKAYLGEPGESGRLPLYAEMQVPLVPGAHDQLLDELLGCAVDVAEAWADWLHGDGAIL